MEMIIRAAANMTEADETGTDLIDRQDHLGAAAGNVSAVPRESVNPRIHANTETEDPAQHLDMVEKSVIRQGDPCVNQAVAPEI
jgi:hypothetical protein